MAEDFKKIETQEELNAIIGERLKRSETKHAEETAGLRKEIETLKADKEALSKKMQEETAKYAEYDKNLTELQGKVKKYETDSVKTRIAKEVGIPAELFDRLRGETEEELKKDAESLKALLPGRQAPGKGNAPREVDGDEADTRAGLREMLAQMNK